MSDKINTVILAAGKGTRLRTETPKPLIPLENKVLVDYVIESVSLYGKVILVTGHENEKVEQHILKEHREKKCSFVLQKEQLGTGHAIQTYFEKFDEANEAKYTIVACADTPLLTKEVINQLIDRIIKTDSDAVAASFIEANPSGYGRIIRSERGFEIVEEKEANDEQKLVQEVNSALYIFKTSYLEKSIKSLDNKNNSGEFYLPSVFKKGLKVDALLFEDKTPFLGINDLHQLATAQTRLKNRIIRELMTNGVRVIDPSHSYIYSAHIGIETVIHPNVHIDSSCVVGRDVTIEPGCILKNTTIEDGSYIKAYTYITDSIVRSGATIGPMSQLRPGSDIGEGSKLGNFVEVKKSTIAKNSSVSHLSYIGDADIGSNVNIGCGFITCNYDGANKHKTVIGDGSFIGSDCQMIAPIEIGKEAYVGSGSTVNKNVPDGAFAIARARQENKEGLAKRFLKKKKPQS